MGDACEDDQNCADDEEFAFCDVECEDIWDDDVYDKKTNRKYNPKHKDIY